MNNTVFESIAGVHRTLLAHHEHGPLSKKLVSVLKIDEIGGWTTYFEVYRDGLVIDMSHSLSAMVRKYAAL